MIARSNIEKNIRQLLSLYNKAKSPKKELYYSKLAIIELCGWIEESMDNIVLMSANRLLKERKNKSYIENPIIKKTYGFEYENHFRRMVIHVIGLVNVEKIEKKVDPMKFSQLVSTLNGLKGSRNSAAHTHIKGIALSIDAPSVTLNNFNIVYAGLIDFDNILRSLSI